MLWLKWKEKLYEKYTHTQQSFNEWTRWYIDWMVDNTEIICQEQKGEWEREKKKLPSSYLQRSSLFGWVKRVMPKSLIYWNVWADSGRGCQWKHTDYRTVGVMNSINTIELFAGPNCVFITKKKRQSGQQHLSKCFQKWNKHAIINTYDTAISSNFRLRHRLHITISNRTFIFMHVTNRQIAFTPPCLLLLLMWQLWFRFRWTCDCDSIALTMELNDTLHVQIESPIVARNKLNETIACNRLCAVGPRCRNWIERCVCLDNKRPT